MEASASHDRGQGQGKDGRRSLPSAAAYALPAALVLFGVLAATCAVIYSLRIVTPAGRQTPTAPTKQSAAIPTRVMLTATLPPIPTATRMPTRRPAPVRTATLVPTVAVNGDLVFFYRVRAWPGPPGEPETAILPFAVSDPEALDEAERIYQRGMAAYGAARWQEAIVAFDEALNLDPRHAKAYNYRGNSVREWPQYNELGAFLGKHDTAVIDYSLAIAADANLWQPYSGRANSYYVRALTEPQRSDRRPWLELALADYDRAVELAGGEGDAICYRAAVAASLGDRAGAARDALQCPADVDGCSSFWAKGYCWAGKYEQALEQVEQSLLVDPDDANLYWLAGGIHLAAGDNEQALADLRTAKEKLRGPFAPGTLWFEEGAALYHLGNYEEAKRCIEQGMLYTWLRWGEPYYYLGMIYLHEGNTERAAEALAWAELTLDEGDPLLEATREELGRLRPNAGPSV